MSRISPDVRAAVVDDFQRLSKGERAAVDGTDYVYVLTRALYDEVQFGPYPAELRTSLLLVVNAAASAHLHQLSRASRPRNGL